MKWPAYWPQTLLALVVIVLESHQWSHRSPTGIAEGASAQWTTRRKLDAREKTRDLWYHGYNSYMRFAFPLDELAPLSCTGTGPDWHNPANIAANDVAGNFSVTLIDAVDSLVLLNDPPGFERAVRNIIDWVSFDVNTKPQVFETTIRVLGGLLAGHQFANQTGQPFHLPWYRGELLAMAHDLGKRLLPAFKTPTGLPYARLNLRHGVPRGESVDTCTAGAGSLILEFGTLSRLTGDDRFEKAAKKAFFALWNRKSDLGLVGNTINTWTGAWLHPEVSGIGAGIDSFYEYALKWYILSGEVEFLDVWQESYAAVMRYARAPDGFWYRSANVHTGDVAYNMVDSLSAFWPGLQVLAGDVENAIKSHMIYWNIWKKYSGLPEVWDMTYRQATSMQYPLRPEFVESTWYLYRATRDPFYLDVGERILYDIIYRAKVECGLTGISDLTNNARDDRMESFVLSETLKYLYLLFDEDNPLHSDDSNYVLTTEGHLLTMSRQHQKPMSAIRRKLRGVEHLQCPAYQPPRAAIDDQREETGLFTGIRSRVDMEYARELIGAPILQADERCWFPEGWCAIPKVDLYSYDFILSAAGQIVPEDLHPSSEKLFAVSDGYVLRNVTGIRAHIVNRLDGKGYDVTKLGPFAVKTGQLVYVNDSDLLLASLSGQGSIDDHGRRRRVPEIDLRIFLDYVDPMFQLQPGLLDTTIETIVTAHTALFGADLAAPQSETDTLRFGHGEGVRVVRDHSNPTGCLPFTHTFDGDTVLVRRGDCTFLDKLVQAQVAGASGVVVISDGDHAVNPSADAAALAAVGDSVNDIAIVVIGRLDGELLTAMLDMVESRGEGQVMLAVTPQNHMVTEDSDPKEDSSVEDKKTHDAGAHRVLYLNGHPLLNTRLIV